MSNQKDNIQVPNAPNLKGLTFRRFKDKSDYPKIVEVANKSWDADNANWQISENDLILEFEHPINFDPQKDTLLAEIDGELAGYTRIFWLKKPDKLVLYNHYVTLLPKWRKTGLWEAMLEFIEQRAHEIAQQFPPDYKHYCEVWAPTRENDWKSLLESSGYRSSWLVFEMVRKSLDDIPKIPLPEGIEIRPVEPSHHRQIWESSKEAFRDERTFSEDNWGDKAYKRWLQNPIFQPPLWQIAWDNDEVVGGIHNFIDEDQNRQMNRKWGWTEKIFVRKVWRKRGLAKALIARSLEVLREHGMEAGALGVDTENPSKALDVYKSMGYETYNQFDFYRKQVE